jgi:hypothetical protein
LVEGEDVIETVLEEANEENADLIVVAASEEALLRNLLLGSTSEQIAKNAQVTVIIVKRRSGPLHSFLRQTVLEPSTGESIHLKNARNK